MKFGPASILFVKAFGDSKRVSLVSYVIFEKKTIVNQLKVLAVAHVLSLGLLVCVVGKRNGRYPFRIRKFE